MKQMPSAKITDIFMYVYINTLYKPNNALLVIICIDFEQKALGKYKTIAYTEMVRMLSKSAANMALLNSSNDILPSTSSVSASRIV